VLARFHLDDVQAADQLCDGHSGNGGKTLYSGDLKPTSSLVPAALAKPRSRQLQKRIGPREVTIQVKGSSQTFCGIGLRVGITFVLGDELEEVGCFGDGTALQRSCGRDQAMVGREATLTGAREVYRELRRGLSLAGGLSQQVLSEGLVQDGASRVGHVAVERAPKQIV
jgi:hypothetical protein